MNLALTRRSLEMLALAERARMAIRRRSAAGRMDRQRSEFYDSVWREAASRLGGRIESLADGLLEISFGGRTIRVCRNYTPLDDPVTLLLAGNKPAVAKLLARHSLPVPRHAEFTLDDIRPAVAFLQQWGRSCVVKPAKDTGAGHGVTTGVATSWQLIRAAATAAAFGSELIIEEQVAGDNYRMLYLDGVLLDAVRRGPPSVVGDGRSNIRALVRRANAARLAAGYAAAQTLITFDADMRRTLADQRLTLRTVPPAGSRVIVKTVINDNASADNEAATDQLCDEVVAAGAEAARAVGARLAGVDVVTADPSRPLEETGGAVLEVNTTPGFYYHYMKQGGRFDVAHYVLRALLEDRAATRWDLPVAVPCGNGQ